MLWSDATCAVAEVRDAGAAPQIFKENATCILRQPSEVMDGNLDLPIALTQIQHRSPFVNVQNDTERKNHRRGVSRLPALVLTASAGVQLMCPSWTPAILPSLPTTACLSHPAKVEPHKCCIDGLIQLRTEPVYVCWLGIREPRRIGPVARKWRAS